jgi:hypothetical protein
MEKSTARSTIGREWTIEHNEHETEQIGQKEQEQLKKKIPGGARFFAPVHPSSVAHPASCTMGTGSSPGLESGRGVTLTLTPF